MELWLKFSLILCVFGFAKELRPSEPFITEFLAGEWRNITTDEVKIIFKNKTKYQLICISYLKRLIEKYTQ